VTVSRPSVLLVAAIGIAFAVSVAVFGALDTTMAQRDVPPLEPSLQAARYLEQVQDTGDPAYYLEAERVLRDAPRTPAVLTELGALALSRHHFRAGLGYGLAAREAAPETFKPLAVVFDGQVELGRYRAAASTLEAMLAAKPTVASYARASYYRELHGNLPGATRAMRLAVAASGGGEAYLQSLLGDLHFARGRLDAAAHAYRKAVYDSPGYSAAEVGLVRVSAARGRLRDAARRLRVLMRDGASADYALLLGELELVLGQPRRAAAHFALTRRLEHEELAFGVNKGTELAVFEADHGSPRRAVAIARGAWRRAPSVRSANALGWALTRAGRPEAALPWARRALRLGSRDPLFLYHAGVTALRAGKPALAERWLSRSLELNPRFSPLFAPRAQRALARAR
jgi:tetratricopeptide (TPR) repeat protein